jgi:bifunctional enzyme CysN/CysC
MAHVIDLSGQDILTYLKTHEHKDLLRFITCGSVDDGKSTLIGRLLYESKLVYEDQLAALAVDSKKVGTQGDDLDLALLVDGLAAEREQGITIDVAYRFFSTDRRKFIVADTPGHEQYTRNMVTGASTADLAIILIDARKGVLTQTRRHSYIVSLLGIRHVVLAVNKMDAVDYDQATFDAIVADYQAFAQQVGLSAITCIPMSALKGENITTRSDKLPWYHGPALMEHLESVTVEDRVLHAPFRLPVQWVNRPNMDFRGFAGQIASGQVAVGDRVRTLPSGKEATVTRIVTYDGDLPRAQAGQSITLTLDHEIDVSRGDLLTAAVEPAGVADQFQTTLIWMHEQPMLPGRQYLLKIGTRTVNATLATPKYRVNVNTLEQQPALQLELNEIGVCNVTLDSPVAFDPYAENRETGGFILIDKLSYDTVGAGLLQSATRRAENIHWQALDVNRAARSQLKGQRACALWFTGLSGSGKSTIANLVEKRLHALGRHTYLLDGDNVRHGLNRDLGFTDADRVENIRRVAEVARLMVDAGLIVLVSFISPFRSERRMAREKLESGEFIEVYVETSLAEAEKRDPKGLYRKARSGELRNFTGIDSPYEAPEQAEITIRTAELTAEEAAERIIGELDKAGVIAYAYNNPLAGL